MSVPGGSIFTLGSPSVHWVSSVVLLSCLCVDDTIVLVLVRCGMKGVWNTMYSNIAATLHESI